MSAVAPSAEPVPTSAGAAAAVTPQSPGQRAWARFRRNRLGPVSLWLFLVMLVLSTAAELASTDKDGRVVLWDMDNAHPLHAPLLRHAGPGLALAWSPDGERLATAGWKQGVLISRTGAADWVALACEMVSLNPPDADTRPGGCPSPAKRP